MTLRERMGIDLSRDMRVEDGVQWAAQNNVKDLDIQLENETDAFGSLEDRLDARDYLVKKAKEAGVNVDHRRHDIQDQSNVRLPSFGPRISKAANHER